MDSLRTLLEQRKHFRHVDQELWMRRAQPTNCEVRPRKLCAGLRLSVPGALERADTSKNAVTYHGACYSKDDVLDEYIAFSASPLWVKTADAHVGGNRPQNPGLHLESLALAASTPANCQNATMMTPGTHSPTPALKPLGTVLSKREASPTFTDIVRARDPDAGPSILHNTKRPPVS
jgi:hypothetical protein